MLSMSKIFCKYLLIKKPKALFLLIGTFFLIFPYFAEADTQQKTGETTIVNLAAPTGLSETEKPRWEHQQELIRQRVAEQYHYITQGDTYFKTGHYNEALQEYQLAQTKGGTKAMKLYIEQCLGWAYEGLGRFSEATEKAALLSREVVDEGVRQEMFDWKKVLEAANQGHYDAGVKFYRELLTTSDFWKRPLMRPFLEQRLHLMEERARTAGQLSSEK